MRARVFHIFRRLSKFSTCFFARCRVRNILVLIPRHGKEVFEHRLVFYVVALSTIVLRNKPCPETQEENDKQESRKLAQIKTFVQKDIPCETSMLCVMHVRICMCPLQNYGLTHTCTCTCNVLGLVVESLHDSTCSVCECVSVCVCVWVSVCIRRERERDRESGVDSICKL